MSYSANVQDVVDKRLASLEYLRKVHGGTISWLNSVHMSKRDFDSLNIDDKQTSPLNSLHYFYLGGSLPAIFEQHKSSLGDYLTTFLNLLKEYETLTGSSENTPKNRIAGVGRRLFRSRLKSADHSNSSSSTNSNHSFPTTGLYEGASNSTNYSNNNNGSTTNSIINSSTGTTSSSSSGSNGIIPKVRPMSGSSISGVKLSPVSSSLPSTTSSSTSSVPVLIPHNFDFNHLMLFHLPFVPDVYETFISLCETLMEAYKHINTFLQPNMAPIHHDSYELLLKVDDKIRKQIIGPTVKDIDSLSRSLIYEESTKLDGLLIQAK